MKLDENGMITDLSEDMAKAILYGDGRMDKSENQMTQNPGNCTITDEEYEVFYDGWGASPCSEYGMCENCPWSTTYIPESEVEE